MWNNKLQTFLVGTIMAVSVSLSGCNSSQSDAQNQDASADTSEQTVAETAPVADNAAADADLDGATAEQGMPVKYEVSAWSADNVEPLNIDELDGIQSTFGKVLSTDENSLDYASNPASKYRFMNNDAPYLDIVDSEKYLELGWYYANPTDSDSEKQISVEHAKKSYLLSKQLMGAEGGKMLEEVLAGQIVKNKTIGGQKVELAKCEFYSCMLVLNKSVTQAEES